MGTFAGYYGKMNIPAEKRPELAERMLKLFFQGGMMNLESVKVMDTEIELLCLPETNDQNCVVATYNYFEDDWWEGVGYNVETGRIWSNKIGWRHFSRVTQAAYVLAEFYSDTFMITEVDGKVVYAGEIIAWLNHLFDEAYTNVRSKNLWEIYNKLLPDHVRHQDLLDITRPDDVACYPLFEFLNYLCVSNFDHFLKVISENSTPAKDEEKSIGIIDGVLVLRTALKRIIEQSEEQEVKLARLKRILTLKAIKDADETAEESYFAFAFASKLLSKEIVLYFIAEMFELDFWKLLEEMEPLVADKKSPFEQERESFLVIPPENTAEFLCRTDDDRAFFWTTDGDVKFSDEMEAWMADLKGELEDILAVEGNLIDPANFFMTFLKTLEQANKTYRRVYAFSSMFQEFIGKAGQREYQAAVILLQRLLKRHEDEAEALGKAYWSHELDLPGRQNIKRYLAVLANIELRQRVFGF